jgi:hypothetical protein
MMTDRDGAAPNLRSSMVATQGIQRLVYVRLMSSREWTRFVRVPKTRPFRVTVVAGGAIVMVGCALAAFAGTWMFYRAYPNVLGDRWFVVLFAPALAVFVVLAGANWTRSVRPSILESLGALLVAELIALAIVAGIAGALLMEVVFLFWAAASVAVAPWWLLGLWIGRRLKRRPDHEF